MIKFWLSGSPFCGRRQGVSRKENHKSIDEYPEPKFQKMLRAAERHLGKHAANPENKKRGERAEIIPLERKRPKDEGSHEVNHAVEKHDVEKIR